MNEENIRSAVAGMLIRRPVAEVFEAFTDPGITTNFWFTNGTGKLVQGAVVTWSWEMYGVSTDVIVKELVQDRTIIISWDEPATYVYFDFKSIGGGSTYVTIRHYGFRQEGDELLEAIKDSTGGFSLVLAGLKAFLEHGIKLNLIGDRNPKELRDPRE